MSVNQSHDEVGRGVAATDDLGGGLSEDRYCHHCREIALAYDPTAGGARCRSCGELA